MQKLLITGASGLLGAAVAGVLGPGRQVTEVAGRHGRPGQIAIDLRDADALTKCLDRAEPEIVVHGAAYREPDFCESHPAEAARLNTRVVRELAARLPEETVLLFVSTDYVFDGTAPPYREDDWPTPINVYGCTKADAEEAVLARPRGIVLRIPLLVGAGPNLADSGFIAQMRASVLRGEPEEVDDVLVRFPTWTMDVARAMEFLLQHQARGVFHFSGLEGGTRYAWTIRMARLLGHAADHLQPSREVVARAAARPLNSQLDPGRIRAMGCECFTPFDEVVREVLSQFGEQVARLDSGGGA